MPGITKHKDKTITLWHLFSYSYHELFKSFLIYSFPINNSTSKISYFSKHNFLFETIPQLFQLGIPLIIPISKSFCISLKFISIIETDYFKQITFHLENPKTPSPKIEGTIRCHYISHNETLFNLSLYFNSYKTSTDISQVISAPSNIKAFYERIDKSLQDIDNHNYNCSYEQFYIEGNFAFVLKLVTNVSITIGLVGTSDDNGDLLLKDGQCFVIKVSDAKISDKNLNLNITIRNVKISWNEFVVVAVLSDSNEVYPNEVNRFVVRKTNVQGKLIVICESKFDKQITLQETKLVLKLRRKFLSKVFKIVNKNYEKQKHKNFIS